MAAENFDACFKQMERWEGWHLASNDPNDPGGLTYSGVTQRAYFAFRAMHGLPPKTVTQATDGEIIELYRDNYWDTIRGDILPNGLDNELFSISVNMGPIVAIKFLQQALKAPVDGVFGPGTLAALRARADIRSLIETIASRRLSYWHSLTTWWRYGVGWKHRGDSDMSVSLAMV